jgi:hypothetical protein
MKPTVFLSLFLGTSSAFAQKPTDIKFQDASAKGAPASIFVKYEPDIGLYAAIRNTSPKGILAFFVIIEPTDSRGQSVPCHSRADFVFKDSLLAPRAERFACPMDTSGAMLNLVSQSSRCVRGNLPFSKSSWRNITTMESQPLMRRWTIKTSTHAFGQSLVV